MKDIYIDKETAEARVFPYESLRPCEAAFVDARIPQHEGKKNYSIVGIGVSQNNKQYVNLTEPHGYNIGAVELPAGNINGLHHHYTAEVFIIQSGVWEFFWGPRSENRICAGPMTIITVPTWLFRGFKNIEEGFIFTVLGEDETGGIVWHPENMILGREHGVYLMSNNKVIDKVAGEQFPDGVEPMDVLSDAEVYAMRQFSVEEMTPNLLSLGKAPFSADAFIDNCLPGHKSYLAPAIGWGLTMDRDQIPPIYRPHTFTIEWLRIPPNNSVSPHRIEESQVIMVLDGELTLIYNESIAKERPKVKALSKGSISVPKCAWREFKNEGDKEVLVLLVCEKDSRKRIEWETGVTKAAYDCGWAVDPSGYVANAHIMKYIARCK